MLSTFLGLWRTAENKKGTEILAPRVFAFVAHTLSLITPLLCELGIIILAPT